MEIYLDRIKIIGQINIPAGFPPDVPAVRNAVRVNYSSLICPTVTVAIRLR